MDYVEVRGKSVDVAIQAALEELGIDRDRAEIEIIQEPEKGFLGMGGKEAVVRVSAKPKQRRRRRRRGGRGDDEGSSSGGKSSGDQKSEKSQKGSKDRGNRSRNDRDRNRSRDNQRSSGDRQSGDRSSGSGSGHKNAKQEETVSIEEQTPVVTSFLEGLVAAFGLEGEVAVHVDDDVIVADVTGPQTEAMVGPRGSTIEAIHELTKTVLQRQTQSSARVRLDIAGYAERRRQALSIYAGQLIDQVLSEGGEVMLEPMSAGDRKTIHDTVAQREGVRSYSEGEAPQRYVVIAADKSGDEEE